MAEISWIKLKTNMFEDEKIKLIERMPDGDSVLVIWIKLLTYAGKVNCNGYIMISENIPMDVEQVSIIFNRPFEKVKYAISVLQKFGMLEVSEYETISITNWEKHQNIEGMDKIRLQNRERKRRQREKQKTLLLDNECHVTVTGSHETDIDKEIEKEINNKQLELIEEEKKEAVPGEQLTKVEKQFFNHYKTLENLPKCLSYHKERKKQVNNLIKKYGIDEVLEYLTQLNERPYIVTSKEMKKGYLKFDMVLRETTYAKCVEGGYMNLCEGYTGEYKIDSDQPQIKSTSTYQVSEFQGLTLD